MEKRPKILFISQEITPYLEPTPRSVMGKWLPQIAQEKAETRTFMPKYGEINERRNQLHEVIRLSGMNVIIDDTDHPLLLKVATLASARLQVYFIDNDDFFKSRSMLIDDKGNEHKDNDERCIFYNRSVLETVKKLRWAPDLIVCSGWMSALSPLYIKKAYSEDPFFKNAKIIFNITGDCFKSSFKGNFAEKALIEDCNIEDFLGIAGKTVNHEKLCKLAIEYSDAVMVTNEEANSTLINFAQKKKKPVLPLQSEGEKTAYTDFFWSIMQEG